MAVALALLTFLLVLLFARSSRVPEKQVADSAVAQPPAIRAIAGSLGSANAHVVTQQTASPPAGGAVKEVLCGASGSELLRGNETIEQHVARVTDSAISHWKNVLAASEDPRRQAIGLALANARPRADSGDEQPLKDTPVNNNLVLLAMETDDPAIYALAMRQCRDDAYEMAPGPCQGLSWEHWAAIDPDNAIPWLWIAAKADQVGNQQRVEDALAKASAAISTEAPEAELSALAIGTLPSDATPLEKSVAGSEVTSILPGGAPIAVISLCSQAAVQRSLRKKQCSAIASILAKQGSTLIDLVLAANLADRLGFPQDTRTVLSAEAKSARTTITSRVPYPWGELSSGSAFQCATVLRYDAYIDALRAARGNERAALGTMSRAEQYMK